MNKPKVYLALAIVLVNLFCLLPVLDGPYLGDDSWCESTTRGVMELTSTPLSTICLETARDFMRDGRWHPLVVYYYPVFYALDRQSYKIGVVVLILLDIILFGYFVRITTESDFAAGTVMLLMPLFYQVRAYHDPILSYYFLMQLELFFLLLSLVFLEHFLRGGKRANIAASVVAYTLVLLAYEAFYGFLLAHMVLALSRLGKRSWKRVCKVMLPFVAVVAANLVVTASLRMLFEPRYKGTTLSLDALKWAETAAKQIAAAFPLSYAIAEGGLTTAWDFTRTYFGPDVFVLCCLWMLAFFMLWNVGAGDRFLPRGNGVTLALIGLVFLVMPAPVIALSEKYQTELRWGLGYLPVYVSAFGQVMLITPLLVTLRNTANRSGSRTFLTGVACALLGTAICGLVYASNSTVVIQYNYAEHYPRRLMERALKAGLMTDVPQMSYLIVGHPFRSWDSPAFYRMHSGLTLAVVRGGGFEMDARLGIVPFDKAFEAYKIPGSVDLYDVGPQSTSFTHFRGFEILFNGSHGPALRPKFIRSDDRKHGQTYYLYYDTDSKDSGYAVLARAVGLKSSRGDLGRVSADRIRVYTERPLGSVSRELTITGNRIDPGTITVAGSFRVPGNKLIAVREGPTWKIADLPQELIGGLADPASVIATFNRGGE